MGNASSSASMGRDPVGYDGGMRAEWDGSTLEAERSLHRGGKLGGALMETFAPDELVREQLAPESVAGDAFANAVRGLAHESIRSWRGDGEGELPRATSAMRRREISFTPCRKRRVRSRGISISGRPSLLGASNGSLEELLRSGQVHRESRTATNQNARMRCLVNK